MFALISPTKGAGVNTPKDKLSLRKILLSWALIMAVFGKGHNKEGC
jgi:hypothetical protein